jgi:hypothetical protein
MNAELSTTKATAAENEPVPPYEDGAGATQFGAVSSEKCVVCSYSIAGRCFCKNSSPEDGPILICCPDCVDQYLDAARGPLDLEEQEVRAFVTRLEVFIGLEKPWSSISCDLQ